MQLLCYRKLKKILSKEFAWHLSQHVEIKDDKNNYND